MLDWQTWIALTVVFLAGGFLLRHTYRFVSGQGESGCGTCPSKANSRPVMTRPLIQLTAPSADKGSSRAESNAVNKCQ